MTQSTGNITTNQLWEQAWEQILTAAKTQKSPFATPVVANLPPSGAPRLRTVVLRRADRDTDSLYCYTDLRSTKVRQLQDHPHLSWLFWDSETRIQFTASGPVRWLEREEAVAIFNRLPKHSRRAYATTLPPATPLPHAGDGLPADWSERQLLDTAYASEHFGVLVTELRRAEVLMLGHDRNVRLRALKDEGHWRLQWIVP